MRMKMKRSYCARLLRLRLVERKLPIKVGTCRPVETVSPPHHTCDTGEPVSKATVPTWPVQCVAVSMLLAHC